MTPNEFLNWAYPYALEAQGQTGVPADVALAVAANETGYGQALPDAGGNNFFGIKYSATSGGRPGALVPTQEWNGSQYITVYDRFAVFDNPSDAFVGFGRFFHNNSRYSSALAQYQHSNDSKQFVNGIWQAGYATSPTWGTQINSLIDKIHDIVGANIGPPPNNPPVLPPPPSIGLPPPDPKTVPSPTPNPPSTGLGNIITLPDWNIGSFFGQPVTVNATGLANVGGRFAVSAITLALIAVGILALAWGAAPDSTKDGVKAAVKGAAMA